MTQKEFKFFLCFLTNMNHHINCKGSKQQPWSHFYTLDHIFWTIPLVLELNVLFQQEINHFKEDNLSVILIITDPAVWFCRNKLTENENKSSNPNNHICCMFLPLNTTHGSGC